MECLAPAGNREALARADAAGADAVYLGYAAFSARAGAGNFDRGELEEAIKYAHLRHMRVHVTVNTLVKDGELEAVAEVLRLLRELHADAVLVQDLGVLRIIQEQFPGLTVHASTQMAIHNKTGVEWCGRQGIRRVVLARECSLDEIRKCAETGTEIEVFGHGAQCVAVSGLCLFSSMVGERSGNRGRCAQPCRMEYDYRGRRGAWLSPRDVCLRDELPKLKEAGVASVKLEGRLKRPEYVAVVTESYRKGLDSLDRGAFEKAGEQEKEGLLQIFNRGGFMKGYALGCEDAGVIFPGAVNHQGIKIGSVASADGKLARVTLEKNLRNGDGLVIRGGNEETGLVYAGPDAAAGGPATLRIRPEAKVKAGYEVFRLTDAAQAAAAMAMKGRTVPVDLYLRAVPGEALQLTATDGESIVTVTGETVSEARTREATEEELVRNLKKTGETVFVPREVKAETAGAFVAVSQVNAIRREALEALAQKRIEAFEKETENEISPRVPSGLGRNDNEGGAPLQLAYVKKGNEKDRPYRSLLLAYARTKAQAEAARAAGFRVIRCPEDYREEALEALKKEMRPGDWLKLPDVCEEDTLQGLRAWTEKHKELLGGIVLGSVGQLGLDWPVEYGAGPGIPVMNRQAAAFLLEEGCAFVTASPELTGSELRTLINSEFCDRCYQRKGADSCSMATVTQIKDLDSCSTIQNSEIKDGSRGTAVPPIVTTVYGRTRLMLLHHCPARTALGLAKGHRDCRMCDEGSADALAGNVLEDRKGYRFPLLRQRLPEGCMVELMNALPTDVINSEFCDRCYQRKGADSCSMATVTQIKDLDSCSTIQNSELREQRRSLKAIVLTTEDAEETEEVLQAFREGRKTKGETTTGHWKRAVE